jgi:ActR/RegA family two-component response regulator
MPKTNALRRPRKTTPYPALTIRGGTPSRDAAWVLLEHVLSHVGGSVTEAARQLGLSRRGIYNQLAARGKIVRGATTDAQ